MIVCEVQNHKELMEMLTPENFAAMTNLYLQTASDYLVELEGFLDECSGENLRVVFGAPVADDKARLPRACRAALDLMHRLDNVNRECDANWQRRFDYRIGVNSGENDRRRLRWQPPGRASAWRGLPVEFRRRLCAAAGTYGCRILVGPETFEQASDTFEARPIEVIKSTGERRRLELYEILAPKHGLSPERERSRDHFWRGVIYFREKAVGQGRRGISAPAFPASLDTALDFYIQRVERSRRGEEDGRRIR